MAIGYTTPEEAYKIFGEKGSEIFQTMMEVLTNYNIEGYKVVGIELKCISPQSEVAGLHFSLDPLEFRISKKE